MLRIRRRIDLAGLVVADVRADLLRLRVELADGDAKCRPRLEHPGAGRHQGQVLLVGDIDQAIQRGVVEHCPPLLVFLMVRLNGCVAGLEPSVGERRGRAVKSGPTLQEANASNSAAASRRQDARFARRPFGTFGWPIGRSGRVRNDEAARIGIVRRISSPTQCTHVALNLEAMVSPPWSENRIAHRFWSTGVSRQAGLA